MKNWVFTAALAATVVAAPIPYAPAYAKAPQIVTEQMAQQETARTVRVLVPQSEIKSDINASSLGIVLGGGLLGGLAAAAQNSSREKKAETLITPIRDGLIDLDVTELAQSTTRQGLANIAWLPIGEMTFGKDGSPVGRSEFLDASGKKQVAFVEYSYDLTPTFDALRLVTTLQIANADSAPVKKGRTAKPEDRVLAKNLAYAQQWTSVILLPDADPKDKEANAARWASNNSAAARDAIALAFADAGRLMPKTLSLTETDVAAMKDKSKPKAAYAGLSGREVAKDGDSTLIWANQFVSVQPLVL